MVDFAHGDSCETPSTPEVRQRIRSEALRTISLPSELPVAVPHAERSNPVVVAHDAMLLEQRALIPRQRRQPRAIR
jgi:hypothetical protein